MYLELLKYRFGVVLVHLCVICLAGEAYHENVRAHLDFRDLRTEVSVRNQMLREKRDEFQTLYVLSVLCVVWELVSVCTGLSSFSRIPSLCSIALNALGILVTLWYCVDAWPSNYFVGIFLLFSFLPALIDGGYFSFYTCFHKATRVRFENCCRRRSEEENSRYRKLRNKDDDDEEYEDTPREDESKASSEEEDTDEEKKRDDEDSDVSESESESEEEEKKTS